MSYASGKYALGDCDYCGRTYKLHALKEIVRNMQPTNLLVCPTCWDTDHPQYMVGRYPVVDYEGLRNARPDNADSATTQWGWNPVGLHDYLQMGLPNDLVPTASVGTVTASAT